LKKKAMREEDLGKQDGYLGFQPSPEREGRGAEGSNLTFESKIEDINLVLHPNLKGRVRFIPQ
jgi:hypothetical protein